jgi:hypothetical protein
MADIDDSWYSTIVDRKVRTVRHGTGKRWQVRWRDAEGAFDRKLDAERFLTGLRTDVMRGIYIDPREGKVTVRAYAEQRSASTCTSHIGNHVVPLLGDRSLGSIRWPDCAAFVAALARKLAPSTEAHGLRRAAVAHATRRRGSVDRREPVRDGAAPLAR